MRPQPPAPRNAVEPVRFVAGTVAVAAVFLTGPQLPALGDKPVMHRENEVSVEPDSGGLYFRLQKQEGHSGPPMELSGAVVLFGRNDPGRDHEAVRISGGDCDLIALYGMDFPLGRGPVGRPGAIQIFSRGELEEFFPALDERLGFKPWLRLNGAFVSVRRGALLIQSADNGRVRGVLRLVDTDGSEWSGEFALQIQDGL